MKSDIKRNRLGNDSSSTEDAKGEGLGNVSRPEFERIGQSHFPKQSDGALGRKQLAEEVLSPSDFFKTDILGNISLGRRADGYLNAMILLLAIRYDHTERSVILDDRVELYELDCEKYGITVARYYLAIDVVKSVYPLLRSRFIWCLETIGLHVIVRIFFG